MTENRIHPTNPFLEFKKEDIEQSISTRFEQMVEMYPDRVAVKDQRETLTYAHLNRIANGIARAIWTEIGGKEGEPVALLLGQQAEMIGALLGVLKAGKCYVPLNPTIPKDTLRYILGEVGTTLIVTDSSHSLLAAELASEEIRVISIGGRSPSTCDSPPPGISSPDSLAFISYTSGSIGKPKGVVHNQRYLLHVTQNHTNDFHINLEDRTLLLYSYAFSASVKPIFGALLNGASVIVFDLSMYGLAPLASVLREERVTALYFTASLFRNFCSVLKKNEIFADIRFIYIGSEPVKRSDVDLYRTHFPSTTLFAVTYAATETGDVRIHFMDHSTRIPSEGLHVGYPIEDKEVIVLDKDGNEAPAGSSGEIAVRSEFLFLEYWKQPELTQAVLLPDPQGGNKRIYRTGDLGRFGPDGALYHLGRKDLQVKVRGYRVEVGEVEARLLELGGVKEVTVHAQEDSLGENRLVAYIVPSGEQPLRVSALRQNLSQKLPTYMIPGHFLMLEALPLTATGKVDRKSLPNPGDGRPELEADFIAPRGPIEGELAGIWSEILGLEQVGVNDPFLELGGDSMRATQIVSRVRDQFNVDLSMTSMLFNAPTVAEMATAIVVYLANRIEPDAMEGLLADVDVPPDDDAF